MIKLIIYHKKAGLHPFPINYLFTETTERVKLTSVMFVRVRVKNAN